MKKIYLFIPFVFVILFSIGGSNLIQQSYAQFSNFEGIELEIQNWKKIESVKSDVLVFTISFINNGNSAVDIFTNNLYLVDSQKRLFAPSSYFDLREKDFSVASIDCPLILITTINPGLSAEENLCYEIPKGIGNSLSLALYNTIPDLCDEPFFDCTIKSFPFTLTPQSDPNTSSTPKIPEWVKNIFLWYGQDQISEDEIISAIQYLVNEGIIKLK